MEQSAMALAVHFARFFLALVFIAAGASKIFQAEEFERAAEIRDKLKIIRESSTVGK